MFSKSIEKPIYGGKLFMRSVKRREEYKAMLAQRTRPWDDGIVLAVCAKDD